MFTKCILIKINTMTQEEYKSKFDEINNDCQLRGGNRTNQKRRTKQKR